MKPFPHQTIDTASLLAKPAFALFVEPGGGKSRTVIDAVLSLYRRGDIDRVVVACPAPARSVWVDPSEVLGEWAKWWPATEPCFVTEYHAKTFLDRLPKAGLTVLVTNPEFIRRTERLKPLQVWAKAGKTLLVVDESWAYKTPNAAQTKAMQRLRACCSRVVILNGTPGSPAEQYSQFRILDPAILNSYNYAAFRARYCVMGGYMGKQIVGFQNMDEFHQKTAPYCVVRKIRDCIDLGPEPVRTQIEAKLTQSTWKVYTELRDELITWLSETENVTAMQAGVKVMRLAQITSGFVGGVEALDHGSYDLFDGTENDSATGTGLSAGPSRDAAPSPLRQLGSEKLDALIEWMKRNWSDPKALVFTRFRFDVERTANALGATFRHHEVVRVYGAQAPSERERAKLLLAPGGSVAPAVVVANAQSGGAGLNFAAAQLCVFLANDYSSRIRRQAEGRVDRPGQSGRVTFLDVLATGPAGQKTVDHHILEKLRKKEEVETMSRLEWLKVLEAA